MVDQPSSKPIATNPIPDLSTIAFAVEGPVGGCGRFLGDSHAAIPWL